MKMPKITLTKKQRKPSLFSRESLLTIPMPTTPTLTFTEAMVRDLAKVASRLANAKYLKVDLLDEATVIMRTIDEAKRRFGYQVNPFDGAPLLDQPQVRKLHDMSPAEKRDRANARRENARLKQQAIDERLAVIGIGAGAVGTWRDIALLEDWAEANPGRKSGWLLNKLSDYHDQRDAAAAAR
jgi:hypothetical protein